MNKLIYILLGIIIGVAGSYLYCSQYTTKKILYQETIVKPKGLISPAEAKTLDMAFNSRHQLISDSIVKRPDNRSSWYSLEDMTNYLKYADSQAIAQGYKMDGIRIYLGAYKDVDSLVGYTTMFMVPTGVKNISESSTSLFITTRKSNDLSGSDALNQGGTGFPPESNYPQ